MSTVLGNSINGELLEFSVRQRFLLFSIAFGPALPILAIRALFSSGLLALDLLVLTILIWRMARLFEHSLPKSGTGTMYEVVEATPNDDGVMAYTLGFLLPAALVPPDYAYGLGLVLFFLIFGAIWARANLGHQNPALALLGWRTWSIRAVIEVPMGEKAQASAPPKIEYKLIVVAKTRRLEKGDPIEVALEDGAVGYACVPVVKRVAVVAGDAGNSGKAEAAR